ncbi:MAG: tRNA (adenosine(37)-N6)-dimethylallyltransferase MiaA [Thermacetogeniaceae bacterium]|jgi:tRNA dimethylallyltransferase|nr:tRNA (adenosine(37)-N6)-dimethylallyltransferase MiaA [Syntrophomonadaceae bacterium]
MNLPLVVITGPTAVGKSEIAVELALKFNGEIISADSVQLYKYFNIGAAKLTKEEQKGIPHHLFDILEPDQPFSVAEYQKLARKKIQEINERGKLPFLVGGTGLYIQSVIDPYEFPETTGHEEIRKKLRKIWSQGGKEELYQRLQKIDPDAAKRIHPNDFRRISRALEVYYLTGKTISSYIRKRKKSLYNLAMIGLTRQRSELYQRIEARVDKMFADGLIEEVKSILEMGYDPKIKPLQSLGYKQVVEYLMGECDQAEAIASTKKATRNYAKRQLTWFRRDDRIRWFSLSEERTEQLLKRIAIDICRSINI